MSKPSVYVYDTVAAGGSDFDPVGLLAGYKSLEFTKGFGTAGSFKIVVHVNTKGATYLAENRIIYLDDERIGWIDTIGIDQSENSANEYLTVEGTELKDQLYRWTLPPTGYDTDSYSSTEIETIVKNLINKNAGSSAASARQITGLATATDQSRGSVIDFSTRHKQLLNEIVSLLAVDRMGLSCAYNPTASTITYDVEEGVDRTEGQSINNQIVLSVDWKTAKQYSYKKDLTNYRNFVYCAGQGEGKDRTIETSYEGVSEPTGYSRRELFVDARDVESDDELVDRAAQKLAETALSESIKVEFNNYGAYTIDDDFKCGDFITAKSDYNTTDAQVIKVTYKYDSGSNIEDISLILDFDSDDIAKVITARFDRYDSLLSDEGNAGDVTGPASATAGNLPQFADTTGKVLEDSGAKPGQVICGSSFGTAITAGQTKYIALGLSSSAYGTPFIIPVDGVISNLSVVSANSPGSGETYTCTIMINNVAQTVTCQIAAPYNVAEDNTHSCSVTAGQRVALRWVSSAGAASTGTNLFGFKFTPS